MCSAGGGTIKIRPAPPDTKSLIFYLFTLICSVSARLYAIRKCEYTY